MLLLLVLLIRLLTVCGVRRGHWHAPALRLLARYSRYTTHARIDAGVRLLTCLWRHEWVGAAWCALLLALTTQRPAGCHTEAAMVALISGLMFKARVEGVLKQLFDAYEHAPAAPSVDQLLKLALHLLSGGLELITLRLLLRSEHLLRGRLCRWLARRRRRRAL